MAQRIRRETTNLKIAGSNPVGDTSSAQVLWCNWLSLWTLNPAIRVQIPVRPAAIILCLCVHAYACMHIQHKGGLAQSEERNVSNVEAPGSKPGFSTHDSFAPRNIHCLFSLVGRALA